MTVDQRRVDMPIYYSQNGEDAILWALFGHPSEAGFFVDVGALDGLRFSNTSSFDQEGWRGVCIEAHATYFDLLKGNRPNSICIHAAVSDHDQDEVEFYANSRGSLSTLDPTMEEYFSRHFGRYFTGFEIQPVKMRTLDSILQEVNPPVPIDLVSIDVEGHEMAVLKGFDLEKYLPRVLVIEAIFDDERFEMDMHMLGAGYFRARELNANIFYCRDERDVTTVATASNRVALHHTQHPLDAEQIVTPDDLSVEEK